jgi:hypothetical protein
MVTREEAQAAGRRVFAPIDGMSELLHPRRRTRVYFFGGPLGWLVIGFVMFTYMLFKMAVVFTIFAVVILYRVAVWITYLIRARTGNSPSPIGR